MIPIFRGTFFFFFGKKILQNGGFFCLFLFVFFWEGGGGGGLHVMVNTIPWENQSYRMVIINMNNIMWKDMVSTMNHSIIVCFGGFGRGSWLEGGSLLGVEKTNLTGPIDHFYEC